MKWITHPISVNATTLRKKLSSFVTKCMNEFTFRLFLSAWYAACSFNNTQFFFLHHCHELQPKTEKQNIILYIILCLVFLKVCTCTRLQLSICLCMYIRYSFHKGSLLLSTLYKFMRIGIWVGGNSEPLMLQLNEIQEKKII